MNFQIALSLSQKRLNDKKVQHLNIILKQKNFKVSDEMLNMQMALDDLSVQLQLN